MDIKLKIIYRRLGDFKEKEALIPDAHLIYINSKGEPSIWFTNYNYEA